ncbi:hypothetical protein J4211_03080 [Candidatus Woesearchaeota archaeon]|nr:hypothetical protein [Candidatus Woesearchaeota archaeon]
MEYPQVSGYVEPFVSVFRTVFEKLFVDKNEKINAVVILNQLKEEKIDIQKLKQFFSKLPDGEWSLKIFFDHTNEINEVFLLSDEYIKKYAVTNVSAADIENIRWEILLESMLEYSKFSNELYDALKYNKAHLSQARLRLLNELMLIFKYTKEQSKVIYEKFKNQKFSSKTLIKFNQYRIAIEFLMLRILYVLLHLADADDKTISHYAELVGKQRISLLTQKMPLPIYT